MASLYGLAGSRALHAGDCVIRHGERPEALYLIVEGRLELRASASRDPQAIGELGVGDCLGTAAGVAAGVSPYSAVAPEPAVVVEVTPAVFDQLAAGTREALLAKLAASNATRFAMLIERHAEDLRRNRRLLSQIRSREERTRAWLDSPAAATVLQSVPQLPLFATDLMFKLLDEHSNANEVGEAIKDNPPLAGLVLKTINSAYYGLRTKVADYYHAYLLLGTSAVYQLVLGAGLQSVLPNTVAAREVQWHSFLVSVLAREIAARVGGASLQVMTTIGLLHDVGRVFALLPARRPEIDLLAGVVRSAETGARVLASWGLPEGVVDVVRRQHDPEFLPPHELDEAHRTEIAILYLAHLAHDLLVGATTVPRPPTFETEYLAALGIGARNCAEFCRQSLFPAIARQADTLPAGLRAHFGGGTRDGQAAPPPAEVEAGAAPS